MNSLSGVEKIVVVENAIAIISVFSHNTNNCKACIYTWKHVAI